MTVVARKSDQYSPQAYAVFDELDRRVAAIFADVLAWRGWVMINDPTTPQASILALIREIFRSVVWYQSHTTEAGFHMLGRLPKNEVRLIQALCGHKAEEAEHGVWAREDHVKIGGSVVNAPASPATF